MIVQTKRRHRGGGFTLLELMTVIVIISILAVLSIQGYAFLIYRAQGVSCATNLKNLYAASTSYVKDNQTWPQISTANTQDPAYAQAWVAALNPYKIQAINWICPSIQRLLGNPDYIQPQDARIDYIATPFPPGPTAPSRYPTQPWFAETASVHGDGNLMIFASGQIKTLNQVVADLQQPQANPY
jgi:prepilin-type N-terminal cleavage/methylation domain-containing protein